MSDTYQVKLYTPEEAMYEALKAHPDCSYADWTPGLNMIFNSTIEVMCWRNEECFLNNDPPKYTESYLKESKRLNVAQPGGHISFGVPVEYDEPN